MAISTGQGSGLGLVWRCDSQAARLKTRAYAVQPWHRALRLFALALPLDCSFDRVGGLHMFRECYVATAASTRERRCLTCEAVAASEAFPVRSMAATGSTLATSTRPSLASRATTLQGRSTPSLLSIGALARTDAGTVEVPGALLISVALAAYAAVIAVFTREENRANDKYSATTAIAAILTFTLGVRSSRQCARCDGGGRYGDRSPGPP